jgi:hypothetical protein
VRLIDDEQRRLRVPDGVDHLGLGQLLGGEEHEADRSVPQPLEHLALVAGRHRRVELGGAAGAVLDLREPLDLVALQGDEWGDDHDRAVEQLARHLVDRRLAGTRREDGEGVAAGRDGLHRLLLTGSEVLEAQDLPGELADAARAHRRRGTGRAVVLGFGFAWRHRHRLPSAGSHQTG